MKQVRNILFLFLVILGGMACNDDDKAILPEPDPLPPQQETIALYVCCEGLWNDNNSSLAYYSYESGIWDKHFFHTQNGRGLGDTANDLQLYGSKLYCVVNTSNLIDVMDARTGKSIKQIPMVNEMQLGRQPRYIAFHANKAYVCSFDGTVARIDTTTLAIEAYVQCGENPDGICVSGGKLWVSNSGGLNFPDYDHTVSVIDIPTFSKIKDIEVGINPAQIYPDSQGDLYLISRGDYDQIPSVLQKIDGKTGALDPSFPAIQAFNFTISRDTAYVYNYSYTTGKSQFILFDCMKETIITNQFIKDGTQLIRPYGINVNPVSGNVFITDALDSATAGILYCFGRDGKLISKTEGIGIDPKATVFINATIHNN